MENPVEEITGVVEQLCTAATPDEQKAAVEKYFMDYASFNHPICCVPSRPNSRDEILGVFQWYRILSPYLTIKVNSVVADEQKETLYLDITQTFHLWFSIFSPKPAKLVTKLKLQSYGTRRDPSVTLYRITSQEDFYHPEQLLGYLLLPPAALPIWIAKRLASMTSNVLASVSQRVLGVWAPKERVSVQKMGTSYRASCTL